MLPRESKQLPVIAEYLLRGFNRIIIWIAGSFKARFRPATGLTAFNRPLRASGWTLSIHYPRQIYTVSYIDGNLSSKRIALSVYCLPNERYMLQADH